MDCYLGEKSEEGAQHSLLEQFSDSHRDQVNASALKAYGSTSKEKNVNDQSSSTRSFSCRNSLIGYALLFIVIVCYLGAMVCDQLITKKTSMIELILLRQVIQVFFILVAMLVGKHSFRMEPRIIPYILMITTGEIVYATCFFFAASVMPAGNIDGSFTAAYVILTVTWDLLRNVISKLNVLTALITAIGLVLILQPWMVHINALELTAPCDTFDDLTNITFQTNEAVSTVTSDGLNVTNQISLFSNQTLFQSDGLNSSSMYYLDYALAIIPALAATVEGATFKQALKKSNRIVPMLFWTFCTESVCCLVLTVAWNTYNGYSYALPSGKFCLLFTLNFTIISATGCVTKFFAYQRLAVSAFAMLWPLVTMLLYIGQRTFLARFHPGKSNMEEILGIVFINIGALSSPLINMLYDANNLTF